MLTKPVKVNERFTWRRAGDGCKLVSSPEESGNAHERVTPAATRSPSRFPPVLKVTPMPLYKVKLRSGELITIEDGRDLTTLSKTLREHGFLQVERRDSDYAPAKMTLVSLMEHAVNSIERD